MTVYLMQLTSVLSYLFKKIINNNKKIVCLDACTALIYYLFNYTQLTFL